MPKLSYSSGDEANSRKEEGAGACSSSDDLRDGNNKMRKNDVTSSIDTDISDCISDITSKKLTVVDHTKENSDGNENIMKAATEAEA